MRRRIHASESHCHSSDGQTSPLRLRDGQTSPLRPRLVVSRSTCPPLSPSPHANSFVIGTAVINTHTPAGGTAQTPTLRLKSTLTSLDLACHDGLREGGWRELEERDSACEDSRESPPKNSSRTPPRGSPL